MGLRLAGKRLSGSAESLGWPVHTLDLGNFGATTRFREQKRKFAAIVNKIRPDIIHAQGADISGYLAIQAGHPAIVTIHGILTECGRLHSNILRRWRELFQARITEAFVVERAANVVAISPYVSRYYGARISGRLYDIPNAIAPSFFAVTRRPEPGRFLFAGRISRGKGLLDLIKAVSTERQSVQRLVLAGASLDRRFQDELASEIERADVASHVHFAGLLDETTLLEEFSRATALVLPSYQETAPMVIQQAMAAGLPVVATRVGGVPDLIESERTGLLHEPGDIDALAASLRRIAEDPELSQRLVDEARYQALSKFTAERVAAKTLAAYKQILKSS